MIRFALRCIDCRHGYEAWFRSGGEFGRQSALNLVRCPACGSGHVEKDLMTPALALSGEGDTAAPGAAATVSLPEPMPGLIPPDAEKLAEALRAHRDRLLARSENVGDRFAEEARRIHFGEAPKRGIHGAATLDDVRALTEDGIEVLPLPVLPGERN